MAPKRGRGTPTLPGIKSDEPSANKLQSAAARCSFDAGSNNSDEKQRANLKHAKAQPLEGTDGSPLNKEAYAYRKVPWTIAHISPKEQAQTLDILAEVRRAMALPLPISKTFHQRAREESSRRWNKCQPLSEEAKHVVDELLGAELSPSAGHVHTPSASSSSSLHDTFVRTQSNRGTNFFSVGKGEEIANLGKQRMSYARDFAKTNFYEEEAEEKKVQDLFASRVALLRRNRADNQSKKSSPERDKSSCESPDVLKEYRSSVFVETEVFHDEGFRRLRRMDFQGSCGILEEAWSIMEQEMLERDAADQAEISKIRDDFERAQEEQDRLFVKAPKSPQPASRTSTRTTGIDQLLGDSDSFRRQVSEPNEVKLILLRSSERLKLEKQQKIALGFDLAMVYARLQEWRKVDEVCEMILGFFGAPGEIPDLSENDVDMWIHFMIRRAVACALLGKEHFQRSRSYLEGVLKLDRRHKLAKRCLQCLRFLEEQLQSASDETRSNMMAALAAI